MVDAGTLPLLVLAFQEPEISLKQVSHIAPHKQLSANSIEERVLSESNYTLKHSR